MTSEFLHLDPLYTDTYVDNELARGLAETCGLLSCLRFFFTWVFILTAVGG